MCCYQGLGQFFASPLVAGLRHCTILRVSRYKQDLMECGHGTHQLTKRHVLGVTPAPLASMYDATPAPQCCVEGSQVPASQLVSSGILEVMRSETAMGHIDLLAQAC